MDTPDRYCDECGAANEHSSTVCYACAHPLEAFPHREQLRDNRREEQAFCDTTPENTPVYMQITLSPNAQATIQLMQPVPQAQLTTPLLHKRYEVLGKVGTGGFGAVYKARDHQANGRMVAIKAIELDTLSASQAIEATDTFNRELNLLSSLNHPHLPAIHEHFIDETHWYLVMDFIDGEPLDEYLQQIQEACLPLKQVLNIGVQLCDVLRYLHQLEPPVIFRDLKPANIMRTPGGRLYLIDFGIARRFKPGQVRDTTPLGSPGFASPEQYGKAQTTPRSDIYSLGVTLYFLLTGYDPSQTPFHLPPIRSLCPTLPEPLAELITNMLALDPAERPASISAVQQVLHDHSPSTRHTRVLAQTHAYVAASSQITQPIQPVRSRRRLKGFLKGIFSLAMICLVILACTLTAHFMGMASLSQASQQGQSQPPPLSSALFQMPYIGHLTSLDPFTTSDPQAANLENLLFGRLVSLDQNGKMLRSGIATSWKVSADSLRWTFYLNPRATFSNGAPITAEDAAASLNYALDTATDPIICPLLGLIKGAGTPRTGKRAPTSASGIQVLDEQTLAITLARPAPFFLAALTVPCGSLLQKKDLSIWGSSNPDLTLMAFSSTYRIASFDSNEGLILTYIFNNPYHRRTSANPPAEIIVQNYPDVEASYAAYQTGLLDVTPALAYSGETPPKVQETYMRTLHYYGMNYLARPFDNLAIRQAFALALDKTAFTSSPWSYPAVSLLGPWQKHVGSDSSDNSATGQPERAKALLAQGLRQEGLSSVSQLPPISFAYQDGLPNIANEVMLAISMWQTNLGVTITPRPLEDLRKALAATRGNATLQLWVTDYTQTTLDPYATLGLPFAQGSPFNEVNYGQNQSADAPRQRALQLQLASLAFTGQLDAEAYQHADQQLSEEVAWLPVYRSSTPYFLRPGARPPFSSSWSPWISLDYCLWDAPTC